MKFIFVISVLFFSILGRAENRCVITENKYQSVLTYNVNHISASAFNIPDHIAYVSGDRTGAAYVANTYAAAITALQKLNAVGGCSNKTTSCLIQHFSNQSTNIYYIFNLLPGLKDSWVIANTTNDYDSAIQAFDQLVQAGGCQP